MRITVGSHRIPVEIRQGLKDLGGYDDEDGTPKIVIRDGPPPVVAQTLLHEALHAVDSIYGLGLNELKVRVLEQALVVLLREAPWIAEQLRGPEGFTAATSEPI
jgi:hypothetical protein